MAGRKEDIAPACRLYLITPPAFEPIAFTETLKAALGAGDVACIQLRLKDVDDDTVLRAGEALLPLAQDAGAAFLVNDRPDLALKLGADGAHVGQEDMPYKDARKLLGPDRIIGVTCHDSRHMAMEAGEAGADYVAFGAFFPTATKEAKSRASLDLVAWWAEVMTVPQVAIGGITVDNCRPLVEAGPDFLAVCAGVWNHAGGPAAAVSAFNRIFAGR